MKILEVILSTVFPPKPPRFDTMIERVQGQIPEQYGDGSLWRAYDVRQTGIEKHFAGRN